MEKQPKSLHAFHVLGKIMDILLIFSKSNLGNLIIINAHMWALLDLPNPANEIISLLTFYDLIENHIRGLSSLGQSQNSYGALLISIIHGNCQRRQGIILYENIVNWNGL